MIKNFFVIKEDEIQDWLKRLRINTLCLVGKGFLREEIYYMPINELEDYIQLINEKNETDIHTLPDNVENDLNDINMAGNTLPGSFF